MPVSRRARSRTLIHAETKPHTHSAKSAIDTSFLDPIITMDEGGVIRSASDSVQQVFGWTPNELFGRNVKMLIPEPRRSALDKYLDRYRNADKTSSLKRYQRFDAIRKDGTVFQIELSMSRAELPVHSAPFFIGIVKDVSRLIDVGRESSNDRSRLHELIVEQTRALATAHLRLQLADRMAALGTLAAGLGHDLNNVLLPVRARLDALEHVRSVTMARTHLKAIRVQIAYLQSLSDGLHALMLDPDSSNGDSDAVGTTPLRQWWMQLGPLLRKAVPKRVSITASFSSKLPDVNIAPQWLTQAMLNLIVNAGEAIPAGRNGTIRIRGDVAHNGRVVRIAVQDNGIGMSREVQRRALDLFFTTKSRSMGTGLGLPLARKVALRAGGELTLSSVVGKGTIVGLELPASREPVKAVRGKVLRRKLAMVSFVNKRVAALIGQVLMSAGFTVTPSSTKGPGDADIWVTLPTPEALKTAIRWRKKRSRAAIVLVGQSARKWRTNWENLGVFTLSDANDVGAIRSVLGQALSTM